MYVCESEFACVSTPYNKRVCVGMYRFTCVYVCVCESITAFLWRVRCASFCTEEAFLTEGSFVSCSYWELQAEKQVSAGSATSHTHTHLYTRNIYAEMILYISISLHIITCNPCMHGQHARFCNLWMSAVPFYVSSAKRNTATSSLHTQPNILSEIPWLPLWKWHLI